MVDSQEIIERSFYQALLDVSVDLGITLDPSEYIPTTPENISKFKNDKEAILASKGFFLQIFGSGNNQSKGIKDCPRIIVNPRGFYPGTMGLPKNILQRDNTSFKVSETPYEVFEQYIDIHLVSSSQNDLRLLHKIMYTALSQRGYLKPYIYEEAPFDGNIFIEVVNFFDFPDLDQGLFEKVYQFKVEDTLISPPNIVETIEPIHDITFIMDAYTLLIQS